MDQTTRSVWELSLRRPHTMARDAVDSSVQMSWPLDWTRPRRAIADRPAVPWMTCMERSAAIGDRPISWPARIAAVTSSGLFWNALGTNEVRARDWAMLLAATADSAQVMRALPGAAGAASVVAGALPLRMASSVMMRSPKRGGRGRG